MGGGNRSGPIDIAATLVAKGQKIDFEVETFVAHAPDTAATLTRGAESHGRGGYAGRRQEDDVNLVVASTSGNGFWKEGIGPLRGREQDSHEMLVAHTLRGEGFDASEDGTGRGIPLVPEARAFEVGGAGGAFTNVSPPIDIGCKDGPIRNQLGIGVLEGSCAYAVRRLTTVECARLQGFPDRHSQIAWRGKPAEACPDGPQYKTYGNSMATNVMAWLGQQIGRHTPAKDAA
jgi:DNA (cytosine-5)-methyltransferase 1